jgi:hypothetical protein
MHVGHAVIRAGHRVGGWVPLHVLHAAQDSLPGAGVRARQAIQGASQEGRRSGDRQVSILVSFPFRAFEMKEEKWMKKLKS